MDTLFSNFLTQPLKEIYAKINSKTPFRVKLERLQYEKFTLITSGTK